MAAGQMIWDMSRKEYDDFCEFCRAVDGDRSLSQDSEQQVVGVAGRSEIGIRSANDINGLGDRRA